MKTYRTRSFFLIGVFMILSLQGGVGATRAARTTMQVLLEQLNHLGVDVQENQIAFLNFRQNVVTVILDDGRVLQIMLPE